MIKRFAKTKAWIKNHTLLNNPRLQASVSPLKKIIMNLSDHVFVTRRLLHAARLPLHVHDADCAITVTQQIHRCRITQAGNIIEKRGPRRYCLPHDFRLVGIDRNRHPPVSNPMQYRQQTAQLLVSRRWDRTWPRRLGADIKDIRASIKLMARVRNRSLNIITHAIT